MHFFFFMVITTLTIPVSANSTYLRRFVGTWKGEYRITSLTGTHLGTFPIEQNNYWVGNQLWGETAVMFPDGSIDIEFSNAHFDDSILRSSTEHKNRRREYIGWIRDNHIWWVTSYNSTTTSNQLYVESLVPSSKGFVFLIDGYQWDNNLKTPNFVHISARLRHLSKDEKFELFDH